MIKYIILSIILIIVLWYICTYNKFKKYLIKIDESLSGIDVGLAKRYNVLTKMVEVVKGYAKYEQETLLKVIKLRNDMPLSEKAAVNKEMDEHVNRINILAENYPDLKANENFKVLQSSIIDVEEHLAASRRFYNSNIAIYNEMLSLFPSNLVAKIMKLKKHEFFEANDEERDNIKIDLDK